MDKLLQIKKKTKKKAHYFTFTLLCQITHLIYDVMYFPNFDFIQIGLSVVNVKTLSIFFVSPYILNGSSYYARTV